MATLYVGGRRFCTTGWARYEAERHEAAADAAPDRPLYTGGSVSAEEAARALAGGPRGQDAYRRAAAGLARATDAQRAAAEAAAASLEFAGPFLLVPPPAPPAEPPADPRTLRDVACAFGGADTRARAERALADAAALRAALPANRVPARDTPAILKLERAALPLAEKIEELRSIAAGALEEASARIGSTA
jgi:hypothetical protein